MTIVAAEQLQVLQDLLPPVVENNFLYSNWRQTGRRADPNLNQVKRKWKLMVFRVLLQ
jgi:hypothetical protein